MELEKSENKNKEAQDDLQIKIVPFNLKHYGLNSELTCCVCLDEIHFDAYIKDHKFCK